MLGFHPEFSAAEAKSHRDRLVARVPSHYVHEIDQIYTWMTDRIFANCLQSPSIEQWQYCKRAMKNPPIVFIDEQIKQCTHFEKLALSYPKVNSVEHNCRLCKELLSDNITKRGEFCYISCHCETMTCHKKCGEEHVSKSPNCYICKQYYIFEPKIMSLLAIIVTPR
jgi:hypothetical protein